MTLLPHRRLLLPLLAALALHGLGLSWAQLQQSRRNQELSSRSQPSSEKPGGEPAVRDNTPELLRFSRQAALTPGLATVTLPGGVSLPPPGAPAQLQTPGQRGPGNGAAARQPVRQGSSAASGNRDRSPRMPRQRPPSAGARRGAGTSKAEPGPASRTSPASNSSSLSGGGNGTVLSLLQQLSSQADGANGPTAAAPPPPRLEGPTAAAYRRLWNEATPGRPSGPGLAGLPATVASRRADRSLLQRLGLSAGHRQAVRLDEQLLVFWQEGPELWLLRLPAADDASPG